MNVKSMFERWKLGFMIYFWVYLAWAVGSLIIVVPIALLMLLEVPLGLGHGSIKFLALLPVLVAPFVVTSDTFKSAIRDLLEQAEEEQQEPLA